jgi:hypothetical protein
VPGVPGRHGTFLVSPRKVPQRRRPEGRVLRCATDSLRFSFNAAAAELAPPMLAGTQTVLADFPALNCDARRDLRDYCPWLRLCQSLACLGRVGSLLPTDLSSWPDGHSRSPTRGRSGSRFVPLTKNSGSSFHFIRATKITCPASRSGIASQPSLQANTRAASSPIKSNASQSSIVCVTTDGLP